jgi:formate hydrogenlyase transcriptional activator
MSASGLGNLIGNFCYWLKTWPRRYGFALAAVFLATVLRYLFGSLFGLTLPFILYYPAIMLVALLGGFGPGILATALGTVSGLLLFFTQISLLAGSRARAVTWLVLFAVAGAILSVLGELVRHHQLRMVEFEKTIEGLEEMIVVIDRDYRYVLANRVFLDRKHLTKEQILGRRVNEVMNPESFENVAKPRLDECFGGKVVQFELPLPYPAVGARDTLTTYYPIAGPAGIERVVCVLHDITEKKRAERAQKLFRTVIDQTSDAIEIVDAETLRFIDVNEKACKELGYTREEMLSLTVFDIDPAVDKEKARKIRERLDASGSMVQTTLHQRRDGSTFPVEISMGLVQPDRKHVVTVSRDISDRKKAEDALRASEDRYRDLVEHSEDLVCTHDLQGRLLSVNPAPARVLGYTVEELLKIPMRELVAPEFHNQFDAYLERIKTAGVDDGFLCVQTKNGERRIWEYHNTLRTEGVAEPIVRGMAHDVTERKRAESALRRSERRYRMLFAGNVAGVILTTFDGQVVDCNDASAQLFGYGDAQEFRNSSILDFHTDVPARQALLEELKRNRSFNDKELQLKKKNGDPIWVLFSSVLLEAGGSIPLIQSTAIDITERKRAEEAIRRNEERFRVAIKDSPITVFNQDRDLRYTWIFNPHLFWQEDIIGKNDAEILGAQRAQPLMELKRRVLETGARVREEVVIAHQATNYSFDLTIEPIFDTANNIVGITGASMDVARLRALADRLQETKERLTQEKSYLESEIETELGFEEIVGQSPALREVLTKARVVAPTGSTVLLLGETGTGKELVARSIHDLSSRHDKSFIKLNCAAVPSGLLESELFGHEKGAFTSAVSQKVGRLELADGGTLFLDEVGELPLELQPKLLRVLQDREFERLGGVRTLRVDVRIISATNRDLMKDVGEKKFREDLFYRLNVFPLQLPPLRDRRSDIPMLVHHFVRKYVVRMGKQVEVIPTETMKILENWNWPGNIRELENMIERMVILSKGRVLAPPPAELSAPDVATEDKLTDMEREHIIRVLKETRGVLSGADGAATRLGIKRTTLQSMLKRFNIEVEEYRRGTGTFGPG